MGAHTHPTVKLRQSTLQGEERRPRVYLAGPIQHSDDYGVGWRERVAEEYPAFEWVNPLDKYNGPVYEAERERQDAWAAEKVVEEDLRLINRCEAVYVGWEEVPSAGTGMEVFYSHRERGIPVVVHFEDPENVSPWIEAHSDLVSADVDECVDYLTEVLLR